MTLSTWRHVSQADIDEWRRKVREDLATKKGTRFEYNQAYHTGFEQGTPEEISSGQATLTAKTATGIRQHRDTVEESARQMISWVRDTPSEFMHRVRILKAAGNFSHLTDEQAAAQLWEICQKLATESARRVYGRDGYDRRFWHEEI